MLRIDQNSDLHTFTHEAMATELSLSLGGVDSDYARQGAQAFFSRVDDVEGKLSLYRESSDVTRINLLKAGEQTRLSEECILCLQLAMVASEMTGQKYFPFLGIQSLEAKGGVPNFLRHQMSSKNRLTSEAAVEIDPKNRLLVKRSNGVLLDFGGIGKGFALDCAMEEMDDWEIPMAQASFGGSTFLFRSRVDDHSWTGSIDGMPLDPFREGAISSSGVSFQGEHIVGLSGEKLIWQRTYSRSKSAALADALSTGAMLMNEESLEGLRVREPESAFAAMNDDLSWGVEQFCKWVS